MGERRITRRVKEEVPREGAFVTQRHVIRHSSRQGEGVYAPSGRCMGEASKRACLGRCRFSCPQAESSHGCMAPEAGAPAGATHARAGTTYKDECDAVGSQQSAFFQKDDTARHAHRAAWQKAPHVRAAPPPARIRFASAVVACRAERQGGARRGGRCTCPVRSIWALHSPCLRLSEGTPQGEQAQACGWHPSTGGPCCS